MPIKTVAILKTFFETGDRPTESQFGDLIDSFVHKTTGAVVIDKSYNEDTGVFSISFSDGITISFGVNGSESEPISFIDGLEDALDGKVDKVAGRGLSTNDFTNALKTKLEDLQLIELPTFYEIGFINGLQAALDDKANANEVVRSVNNVMPDDDGNVVIPSGVYYWAGYKWDKSPDNLGDFPLAGEVITGRGQGIYENGEYIVAEFKRDIPEGQDINQDLDINIFVSYN